MPTEPPPAPSSTDGGSHYFDAVPTAPSAPRTVELTLPDLSVTLATDRAVFAGDHIDAGTKYLLLEAPTPDPGVRHVLDLGCGYGPIAVTLAHRAPTASVWAVDVNERAVGLCRANAETADVADRVDASVVTLTEPFGTVPDDITFDLIWSNPPIRIGKPALHELLIRWLARLSPTGQAVLVVQKHLGSDSLQRWLTDQGWKADRLSSRSGYRLLRVARREADG